MRSTKRKSIGKKAGTKGKTNEYPFSGQQKFALRGSVACTSIAMATTSRLLRMPNEEFFMIFNPTIKPDDAARRNAGDVLDGCVQTGVDLNAKISTGTFSIFYTKSCAEVANGISHLDANFGGVQDLVALGESPIKTSANTRTLPSIDEFRDELIKKFEESLLQDEIAFIATGAGHTTVLFSRTDEKGSQYFYLVDSQTPAKIGLMEVFDNFRSAAKGLLAKWSHSKKNEYADITAYTLSDALRNKMQHNDESRMINP